MNIKPHYIPDDSNSYQLLLSSLLKCIISVILFRFISYKDFNGHLFYYEALFTCRRSRLKRLISESVFPVKPIYDFHNRPSRNKNILIRVSFNTYNFYYYNEVRLDFHL